SMAHQMSSLSILQYSRLYVLRSDLIIQCTKDGGWRSTQRDLCLLSDSAVGNAGPRFHHRGTENTKVAQRYVVQVRAVTRLSTSFSPRFWATRKRSGLVVRPVRRILIALLT